MKQIHTIALITILAGCLCLIPSRILLRTTASAVVASPQASGDARDFLSRVVTARAAGRGNPWVNLRDGSGAPVQYAGSSKLLQQLNNNQLRPLSAASADFDEDGVPDLVAGYSGTKGGVISIQRGDPDTIYPNTSEAIAHRAQLSASASLAPAPSDIQSPFFVQSQAFDVSGAPQFLGTGDFDCDGHRDVVSAEAGSSALVLLSGDGHGSFAPSRSIALPGRVTALIAGDVNRIDGLADVVVAVNGPGSPALLVYEGANGALKAAPEIITMPAESTSIALGQLDDKYPVDIAVAAGRDLLIIHGRDRKHSRVAIPPVVTRVTVSISIAAVAIGDFTGELRHEIALLSDDGSCHVFSRTASNGASWQQASALVLPVQKNQPAGSARLLVRVRVSSSPKDDLLLLDQAGRRLQMLVNESVTSPSENSGKAAASAFLRVAGAIDFDDEPLAVAAMRLNPDALNDLVVFKSNSSAPSVIMTNPAATFSVINTNDSGAGSLRQAIQSANSNPGADSISFSIPGPGTQTISPLSPLPAITGPVTIDGTTQNPGSATPPIEVNGASAGMLVNGLTVAGGNSTVRGLVINRFDGVGIDLSQSGDIVDGNFIGTNAAGTASLANTSTGVLINTGSGHLVGGTVAAARNVLSGNLANGVQILIGPSMDHLVQGNLIGTDVTGTVALGNQGDGVMLLSGTSNIVNCTVGGTTAGAGNVISANTGVGVQLITVGTSNLVQGNLIGTDAAGSNDLGNGSSGVALNEANDCTVGGTVAGAGNVISGNGSNGIRINALSATANLVQGNKIGTRADGATQLPNGSDGVLVLNSANNNTIGGVGGAANLIAFNLGAGVMVATGNGNAIRSNSIFSNGGLGIDLSPAGVTPNDAGDADGGANTLQNFPVLTAANGAPGGVNLQGTLNSTPSTTFTLDFFSNAACDAAGNGEGRTFLGSATTTTNGAGNATFNATLTGSADAGESITATATNPGGSTSEFSACFAFGAADLAITKVASSGTIVVGSNVTYTITLANNGPDSAISITVTDNLPASLSFVSCSSNGGGVCGGSGNNRIISFSSLSSGASAVITIVASVDCSVPNGQVVANTASVTSTVLDPVSGNNSSSVNFTASNPPRAITPTSASFASDGGNGTVTVTAPAGCGWQALSNDAFIVITSGSSGTGNGIVGYSVAVNSTGSLRSGTMTIAGLTFTVNQSNVSCSYSIMPTSNNFTSTGGAGSVSVTASPGCLWNAASNDNWLTVVLGTETGIGNGSFDYTVAANPDITPRTGTITIAGLTFTVMQGGVPCSFSLQPTGKLFSELGSEASFTVTTANGCEWTPSTEDSWIFIISKERATGPGTVDYGVRDNFTGVPRQGAITVGGVTFNVVQDGGTLADCIYLLNPTSANFNALGGNASVQVFTEKRCAWEATTNVTWITFKSEIVGIGNGSVSYTVKSNPRTGGRAGLITIGGQTLRVKQKGS